MNRADFERKCRDEGYRDIVDRRMEADDVKAEHAHEFDACVLVVEGEMTITRGGAPERLRAGDICTMPAGTVHAKTCGPAGVYYLAGRRFKTAG